MECRPFKDPSFDKYILEQDTGSQAIPVTKDEGAQTVQLSTISIWRQSCLYQMLIMRQGVMHIRKFPLCPPLIFPQL